MLGCGRPRIITEALALVDALAVAWLLGTEGAGLADALLGDRPFSGRLPFSWPRSMAQIPLSALRESDDEPLWRRGFGLS